MKNLVGSITCARSGQEWHVLGHTYWLVSDCESSFAFETYDSPGTFVPPHIHPEQLVDPDEVVRLSALHGVNFLPPPA